ncbi:hypothetical protein MOK15_12055 [Sphingobium sp. BYY-5]|uniref:hypothetical protein n=1 Tax=Sphingobium sp. BYY-5 TaxID=2926400 RepID=UPI001FA74BB9|nr:hypothetical protein [Sphingobium sp. BYY-5]MCI4590821.1 hypothetical protein [Sphingobium sp. BYY-5]
MFLANQDWSNGNHDEISLPEELQLSGGTHCRPEPSQENALTTLEQCVVALSLFDHPSSLEPPLGIARFIAWLSGNYAPNRLADERLEALRSYCILFRAGAPYAEARERAHAAGLSPSALDEAKRLILRSEPRR